MRHLQGRWRRVGAGLELARRRSPDLILLDVHLPDVSGEVVLRELRADARTRAVPVVVLSADVTAPRSSGCGRPGRTTT